METLTDKVALVTGAAQGIGAAIASRLARDGVRVVVADRNRPMGEKTVEQIVDQGGRAAFVEGDISQLPAIKQMFEQTMDQFGQLDILVNNAGINGAHGKVLVPFDQITEDEYEPVFTINVRGTLFCLVEAFKHLSDNGRIINLSSSTTVFSQAGIAIYSASKAAVKEFTEVAAIEFGKRGITVNSVLPGVTDTPMNSTLTDEHKEQMARTSPFNRMGQPADIADVVAFLASDDARWITGQHLLVNGGSIF